MKDVWLGEPHLDGALSQTLADVDRRAVETGTVLPSGSCRLPADGRLFRPALPRSINH
jgi:hypothetical protein